MTPAKKRTHHLFILSIIIISFALLAATTPQDLPPRPTPAPNPTPVPTVRPSQPKGALIQLTIDSATPLAAQTWTAVQWQDPLGDWYLVDGWQGNPDNKQQVTWWVAPADLGSGPFRWLIFADDTQNNLLHSTDSFTLPAHSNQDMQITAVIN